MKRTATFLAALTIVSAAFAQAPAKRVPLPSEPPETVKAELDVTYGKTPEQELKLDVYRPKAGGDRLPACVLVHGGGWMKGDKEKFRPLAIALAERATSWRTSSTGSARWRSIPRRVQDCSLAVRWVRANAKRLRGRSRAHRRVGRQRGRPLVGLLAAAPGKFLTGDLKDVSAGGAGDVHHGRADRSRGRAVRRSAPPREREEQQLPVARQALRRRPGPLPRSLAASRTSPKATGPVLFLTGDLDNPDRDTAGLAKLKSLGVPTKQVILKDAKHGCWMQRPGFEQCVEAVDAWFQVSLK